MLIEEIERLHIDLWNATAREQTQDQSDGDDQVQARLEPKLRARLRRARDR
jgi:hypothetical protein